MHSKSPLLKVAGEIDELLGEVISLQKDFVARVCPSCEEPCCKRVRRLFDEKDTIFAKASGRNGVPKRSGKGERGCAFLTSTGCLLTPKARPFICHRYLCPALKKEMAEADPELVKGLSERFRVLEELRVRLWKEYLKVQGESVSDVRSGRASRSLSEDPISGG